MKAGTLSGVPMGLELGEHGLVGRAVQGAVEGRRGAGEGRVGIALGRADDAHRGGAGVLLVVGVEDEEHVERPLEDRVRLVLHLGHLEHHVEEVADVGEAVVGPVEGPALVVPVGAGGYRRHLRDDALDLEPAVGGVGDLRASRGRGWRARRPS